MAWFDSLFKWISKRFGKKKKRSHPQVLRRYYSDISAVLQIQRSTKGAVATYRIIPARKNYQILITLDSLREIEGEMVGKFDGESIYLRNYSPPPTSHRFAVWKIVNSKSICLGCWDINLEGNGSAAFAELAPRRICASFATYFLKKEISEKFDWLGLMNAIASQYFGKNHPLRAIEREIIVTTA